MTLMIPHTLYGIGIWWSPLPYMEKVLYGPPHVCMVPPTCMIWWFPFTLYGTGIVWSPPPPNVRYNFFRLAWKESTACPNKKNGNLKNKILTNQIFCMFGNRHISEFSKIISSTVSVFCTFSKLSITWQKFWSRGELTSFLPWNPEQIASH